MKLTVVTDLAAPATADFGRRGSTTTPSGDDEFAGRRLVAALVPSTPQRGTP